MRLPGSIEERLRVLTTERARLLLATEIAVLDDDEVRVECNLAGLTSCIWLDLPEQGIKILRLQGCADFALLLAQDGEGFEAHVYELTRTVARQKWDTAKKQLEGAVLNVLAIAGILGIEIRGVVTYTAFNQDRLSRESSPSLTLLKQSIDPTAIENARRGAEARRSWERGHIWMDVLGRDVEHRRIEAPAAVECRPRASSGDTLWIFEASA